MEKKTETKNYTISYSGITDYAYSQWNIKKLEKVINKLNVEKCFVWVSESSNGSPLVTIDVLGERIAIIVDSMNTCESE